MGPSIARGSQPENGSCADLPIAESRNSSAIAVDCIAGKVAAPPRAEKRADPSDSNVITVAISKPASEKRYVANARTEERTGSSRSWKNPMKNADEMPISSQPAKNNSRAPASATSCVPVAKRPSSTKKRVKPGSLCRYVREKRATSAVSTEANSAMVIEI